MNTIFKPHIDSCETYWPLFDFTVTTKARNTPAKDWRVVSAVVSGGLLVILVASVVVWQNKKSQLQEYSALKQGVPSKE